MKHLILLGLLCTWINGFGQTSIRVVAASGYVTINGQQVLPGVVITDEKSRLIVDNDSYVYVITPEGRSAKLAKGSYKVSNLTDEIDARTRRANRPVFTTAVRCRLPYAVVYEGMTDRAFETQWIIGDSLFLRWGQNPNTTRTAEQPYGFQLLTMFEDPLYTHSSAEQFVRIDLKPMFETEKVFVAKMKSDFAPMLMIKKADASVIKKIADDLAQINAEPQAKRVLDLVIYEGNDLLLDLLYHYNKKPIDTFALPADLKNYVAALENRFKIQ